MDYSKDRLAKELAIQNMLNVYQNIPLPAGEKAEILTAIKLHVLENAKHINEQFREEEEIDEVVRENFYKTR